jgi:hypothetical protein
MMASKNPKNAMAARSRTIRTVGRALYPQSRELVTTKLATTFWHQKNVKNSGTSQFCFSCMFRVIRHRPHNGNNDNGDGDKVPLL